MKVKNENKLQDSGGIHGLRHVMLFCCFQTKTLRLQKSKALFHTPLALFESADVSCADEPISKPYLRSWDNACSTSVHLGRHPTYQHQLLLRYHAPATSRQEIHLVPSNRVRIYMSAGKTNCVVHGHPQIYRPAGF